MVKRRKSFFHLTAEIFCNEDIYKVYTEIQEHNFVLDCFGRGGASDAALWVFQSK